MQAVEEKRVLADKRGKSQGTGSPQDKDIGTLIRETERLRDELDRERKKVETLEDANSRVAKRLDVAIESVKTLLARQG